MARNYKDPSGGWILPNPLGEAPEDILLRSLYEADMHNDTLVGLIYFAIFVREFLAGSGAHTRRAFKHHGCTPNRVIDNLRLPMSDVEREIVSSLVLLIRQGKTASELLDINQQGIKHTTIATPKAHPDQTPILGDCYGDDLDLD